MTLPLSEHSCCIVDSSPTIARDTNDAFAPDLWAFENPEPINPRFNVNYTRFLHYLQKFCKAGPAKINNSKLWGFIILPVKIHPIVISTILHIHPYDVAMIDDFLVLQHVPSS